MTSWRCILETNVDKSRPQVRMAPPKKSGSKQLQDNEYELPTTVKRPKSPSRTKSPAGPPKSPSRTKSPARAKSPGRPKSPGRQPKSPSRAKAEPVTEKSPSKPKADELNKSGKKAGRLTPSRRSPIRKSPSRSAKLGVDNNDKTTVSSIPVLRRKQKVIDTESESDTADDRVEVKEKPKAAVRGRARSNLTEIGQGDVIKEPSVESTFLKRVTRSQNREVERIVHLKQFDVVTKKLGEFSDEDELLLQEAAEAKAVEPKSRYEYGGPIGAGLITVTLPLLVFLLFAYCSEKSCPVRGSARDFLQFKALPTYFNVKVALGYLAYVFSVAVASFLPFCGWKVASFPPKPEKFVYLMNGLFVSLQFLLLAVGMEMKGVQVAKFITENYFRLCVVSLLVAVVFSAAAYARSFYVTFGSLNPNAVTQSKFYNFFVGRELHPRLFGRLDLKVFVFRLLCLTTLLIDVAFAYQSLKAVNVEPIRPSGILEALKRLNPTLAVYFLLHWVYIFDGLLFEHRRVFFKELQQEGFGYLMLTSYFLYPFIATFPIKYIVEHNVQLSPVKLALIALAFAVGYTLYRGSNNAKHAFRRTPYNPSVETIPTSQGKKLLCSGFWGIVRHPNYLGNIIIELAFVPFVWCSPPVIFKILNVLFLVHRARRDNQHCKQKYGLAWDRYCNRVRYILVPRVY